MKLRILLLALIIFFPLVLTGCWDYEEYEDMAQVSAIGIDFNKESRETTLTVQYIPTTKGAKTGGGEGSNSSAKNKGIVHSATAKTLYEALTKLQQVTFKKLFYGYLKVFVIGEDAAKYNFLDIMELLDRTPAIRSTTYMAITPGKAEDTISTFDAAMEGTSSEELYNLINLATNTGAAYRVTVQDLTAMLAVPGIEATAPRVVTVSKIPHREAKGGVEGTIRYDEEREGDHRVAGVAAFKGDKFVGWLDEQASLGLGFITGKNLRAYKVSETSDQADPKDIIYYRLVQSKGNIKVHINKEKPDFQVDVKVVADLRKYYSNKGSGFLTPKEVKVMEKKLADSIRSDMEAALRRGQKELKSDIFGFGFALFRENPKLWRTKYEQKWSNVFPSIPVRINVAAKIINTGTNNRKLQLR